MERAELEARFAKAVDEIKAAYNSFTYAERMHSRKAAVKRAVAEMVAYRMQRKVSLARLGIDVDTARQLMNDGYGWLHMDRHRHPEAFVLKTAMAARYGGN